MNDNEQYSKLLTSIKVANTQFKRTLSPIQVSELIQKLINEEGFEAAESMLPLSKKLMQQFTSLLKLPEECKGGVIWGKSGDLGVGFSVASEISKLKKKDDQMLLFSLASEKSISEDSIQKIISFYHKNKDLPLVEIIEKITNARPKKISTYLVIVSISEDVKNKLKLESYQMKKPSNEILQKYMIDKFQIKMIDGVQIKNNNVAFAFNESEYRKYKTEISKLGLEYDKITEYIIN